MIDYYIVLWLVRIQEEPVIQFDSFFLSLTMWIKSTENSLHSPRKFIYAHVAIYIGRPCIQARICFIPK